MGNAITISCNLRNLKVVRDFVTVFLATYQLSDVLLNQVLVAVDEIVANLIIHANSEDDSQFLKLKLGVEDQMFSIEIEDASNQAYTPSNFRDPDLREYIRQGKKGGVGMALVNRFMDHVEFETGSNHNVCRLYKRLN